MEKKAIIKHLLAIIILPSLYGCVALAKLPMASRPWRDSFIAAV